MNFDDVYQLLEILESDNERTTYAARESATGRDVFVHLLAKSSDRVPSLLTIARQHAAAQADASGLELKIGTFRTQDCLVTMAVPELQNVRRGLEQTSATSSFDKAGMWKVPATIETVPDPAPKTSPVGDFTRMFSQEKVQPAPSQGEFTRMFQASAARPPAERLPLEPAPTESAAPPAQGSFTQMFSAPPSAPAQPGEFTRMFHSEPSAPPELATSKPLTPAPPESPHPGEFTRMFKPDTATVPPSKGNWLDFVERPASNNSLDSINWDSPQTQGATGAFAVPATTAQPSVAEGPSEFTRLIAVPSSSPQQAETLPATAASSQPVQPQPSQKATSNLPLIIGVNVVILTVIALILYFVLRS